MSRAKGVFMVLKGVCAVFHRQKPSWCLAVRQMYFMPADCIKSSQASGSKDWGVPAAGQLLVVGARHAGAPLLLLVPALDGIQPPVHEEAEPLLEEPVARIAKAFHAQIVAGQPVANRLTRPKYLQWQIPLLPGQLWLAV